MALSERTVPTLLSRLLKESKRSLTRSGISPSGVWVHRVQRRACSKLGNTHSVQLKRNPLRRVVSGHGENPHNRQDVGACEVQGAAARAILHTAYWQVFRGDNFNPLCFINGGGSWEPHWLSWTEPTSAPRSPALISLSARSPKFCVALLGSPPSTEAQRPPQDRKRSPQGSPLTSHLSGPWETVHILCPRL